MFWFANSEFHKAVEQKHNAEKKPDHRLVNMSDTSQNMGDNGEAKKAVQYYQKKYKINLLIHTIEYSGGFHACLCCR